MLGRFGNVLYWLANVVSAMIAAFGIYMYLIDYRYWNDGHILFSWFAVASLLTWAAGLTCRYMFPGR